MSVARVTKRGKAFALCVDALRKNGSELSTRDLANVCMEAAGLDTTNAAQRRAMMRLLIEILTLRCQSGEIVKVGPRVCPWQLPEADGD